MFAYHRLYIVNMIEGVDSELTGKEIVVVVLLVAHVEDLRAAGGLVGAFLGELFEEHEDILCHLVEVVLPQQVAVEDDVAEGGVIHQLLEGVDGHCFVVVERGIGNGSVIDEIAGVLERVEYLAIDIEIVGPVDVEAVHLLFEFKTAF